MRTNERPRARLGSDGLGHQAGHSLPGEGTQAEMPGAGSLQHVGQPVQLGAARGGPQAPDNAYRKTGGAAGQRTHREQAGRDYARRHLREKVPAAHRIKAAGAVYGWR
jgi:hypothetical protein